MQVSTQNLAFSVKKSTFTKSVFLYTQNIFCRTNHILKTVDAMERYLQFAIMAQGIAQRIASGQEIGGTIHRFTSKRSKNAIKVSEEDICNYLSAHLSLLLAKYSDDELIQFIRGKQSVEDAETAFNLL